MQKQMKSLFVALVCMTIPVMAQKTDQVNPIIGNKRDGTYIPRCLCSVWHCTGKS